jgi:hypothetical protein
LPFSADGLGISAMIPQGDTASVLELMKLTMGELDAEIDQMERRDTTVESESAPEPRRLSVWLRDGVPRKLTVSEPDDLGAMTQESSYWFVGEELRVAERPGNIFFLEGDRLLLWTDGALVPFPDVDTWTRMNQEQVLLDEVERWLGHFGLALQSFVPH